MEVNLRANEAVMDRLRTWGRPIDQILVISSGAAALGKGWRGEECHSGRITLTH